MRIAQVLTDDESSFTFSIVYFEMFHLTVCNAIKALAIQKVCTCQPLQTTVICLCLNHQRGGRRVRAKNVHGKHDFCQDPMGNCAMKFVECQGCLDVTVMVARAILNDSMDIETPLECERQARVKSHLLKKSGPAEATPSQQ